MERSAQWMSSIAKRRVRSRPSSSNRDEQCLEQARLGGVVAVQLAHRGGRAAEPGDERPELGAGGRGEAVKHWIVLPCEGP